MKYYNLQKKPFQLDITTLVCIILCFKIEIGLPIIFIIFFHVVFRQYFKNNNSN